MPVPSTKFHAAFIAAYREGLGPRLCARLSDAEICDGALRAAACVEREIDRMQHSGEFKSVNRAYRDYRLEASARGEKILTYAAWMGRYQAALIREIAANLR